MKCCFVLDFWRKGMHYFDTLFQKSQLFLKNIRIFSFSLSNRKSNNQINNILTPYSIPCGAEPVFINYFSLKINCSP